MSDRPDRPYVRVTPNGSKSPVFELMTADGSKICELSIVDIIEMSMQMTSALRFALRN